MFRFIAVSGLIAAANAEDATWAGSPATFASAELWSGAGSPNDAQAPSYTVFGTLGKTTVATATAATYQVGRKIELQAGPGRHAKLFLGSGTAGERTVLQLTPGRGSVSPDAAAYFQPTELDADTTLGGSTTDWGCHLNWQVTGQADSIPQSIPTSGDVASMPRDSDTTPYLINIPRRSAISQIDGPGIDANGYQRYTTTIQDSCDQDPTDTNPLLTLEYQHGYCDMIFSSTASQSDAAVSTCGDFTTMSMGGDDYQVYTEGPRAGQAYKVRSDDTLERDLTVIANVDDDGTATFPDMTTSGADRASGSEGDKAGGTLIAIVIAAAIIIIVIIVAVVVVKSKNDAKNSMREAGTVSFENPMYDDANGNMPAQADDDGGGMYDNPTITDDASGYMDVPAGGGGASGYMDVPASGGSGYMDVAPDGGGEGASGYMDVSPEGFGGASEDEDGDI